MNIRKLLIGCGLVFFTGMGYSAPTTVPMVPFKVPAKMRDAIELLSPSEVKLEGFIGERIANNANHRLAQVDLEPLLAGFRQKPGSHPWIGEHIGKWMHAATLAWAYTGDPALRAKLDYAAAELIKTQEPDGYLGTYVPEKRFGLYQGADWDVWSHKYCLMGLLTYYQHTGNEAALAASRKAGDLLAATFPAKKSILASGTHVGMAATSVLEPMVLLYRFTGDAKYLDFARYIVKSWDETNGPKIIATLLKERKVNKTANAKAYEMLSNLVGLCELARVTGDEELLAPVQNAVFDIIGTKSYITGGMSQGEHFNDDFHLPNATGANVSETCVTTTWIQLLMQIYRLRGAAMYGQELERVIYNHLAAAQRPDGAQWCYFTALEGTKPYGPGINCCVSSGPRGMALAAQCAYFKSRSGSGGEMLRVNFFESGRVTTTMNGEPVTVTFKSDYPDTTQITVSVETPREAFFAMEFRLERWARGATVEQNGQPVRVDKEEWYVIPARKWKTGDTETITIRKKPAFMEPGHHGNEGLACLRYGPFVLAYDLARNPGGELPSVIGLADNQITRKPGTLEFTANVRSARNPRPHSAVFVPFADAGGTGGRYKVWLRAPGALLPVNDSLFAGAKESRSRQGNLAGAIADGDPATVVVTFDGRPADEDWYAVTAEQPVAIGRVVFHHGKTFHDGGWFDASAGKPRVQIQRTANGEWVTVGTLENYPNTTATSNQGLKDGQPITLVLREAVKAAGLRIIGKPANGDNPKQAFSSCAELQAFAK